MALKLTTGTVAEIVLLTLLIAGCASTRFFLSKRPDNITLGPGCAEPLNCSGACALKSPFDECALDGEGVCTCWCPDFL